MIERLHIQREPLLTTAVVAKWLQVSSRTLRLWAECAEIPAVRVGRQWRFRRTDVLEWMETRKTVRQVPAGRTAGS
jgi:excisionase family DNA binding protein